jgi:hypothetical protein
LKLTIRMIPVLVLLVAGSVLQTRAQGVSAYFGVGAARASSSNQTINTFGDQLFVTPRLTGVFGIFGADFMLNKRIGVGGEYSWRMKQGSYAGLNYRPSFYDFNVIWHPLPISATRVVPEFQTGLGGTNLKFYYNQRFCDMFAGCSTTNTFLESSNHFQLHLAAGVRLYVRPSLFVKPQIDVHWVHNFSQFGTSWVPEYSVAVGYTFGER